MISYRAQTALERGEEWEARGNPVKAINAYREAAAIDPDWLEPHQRMGVLYLELGRYDEAAAAYRQAQPLAASGDGSIDDLLQVITFIQEGELDSAAYGYYVAARNMPDSQLDEKIALCQKALNLNPCFAAPYAILGKMLLAKGQPNQARVVLERGLACKPSLYTWAELLFALGNVLMVIDQRSDALDVFRQVVELDANPAVTRFATKQLEAMAAGRI